MSWMRMNELRLNPDNTEVLLVGSGSVFGSGSTPMLDEIALSLCSLGSSAPRFRMTPGCLSGGHDEKRLLPATAGSSTASISRVRRILLMLWSLFSSTTAICTIWGCP